MTYSSPLALLVGDRIAVVSDGPTPTPTPTPVPSFVQVAPGAEWNGTAGSGGTPPADSDTARTTAKPITSSIDVGTYFASSQLTGIIVFDGDGVNAVPNCTVRCWCEGAWFDVPFGYAYHPDLDILMFGYFVELAGWAQNGGAYVAWEVTSSNGLKQKRVVNKRLYTKAATQYDGTLTFNPDAPQAADNYQYFGDLIARCRDSGYKNPRIIIQKSGAFNPRATLAGGANGYAGNAWNSAGGSNFGRLNIECAEGVSAWPTGSFGAATGTYGIPAGTVGNNHVRMPANGVHWGQGCIIDLDDMDIYYPGYGTGYAGIMRGHVFGKGCTIRHLVEYNRYVRGDAYHPWQGYIAGDFIAFIGAKFDTVFNAAKGASPVGYIKLVFGCEMVNVEQDLTYSCDKVLYNFGHSVGLTFPKFTGYDSFTVTSTAAFWQIVITGGNLQLYAGASAGTLTAVGSAIPIGRAITPSDVSAAIAAIAGFSRTNGANVDKWPSQYLRLNGAATGTNSSAVMTAGQTLTVKLMSDNHADLAQWDATQENVVIAFNRFWDMQNTQGALIVGGRDVAYVGNAVYGDPTVNGITAQFGGGWSHLIVDHNTLSMQLRFNAGQTIDTYSRVRNNLLGHSAAVSYNDSSSTNLATISGNHFVSAPTAGANATSGSSLAAMLVDPVNGDFAPRPGLVQKRPPTLRRAVNDNQANEYIGATL